MAPKLRFREKINRQSAEEMLHAFVACGENSNQTFFWSPAQVRKMFGHSYEDVIAGIQRGDRIPRFENLLRSTFQIIAPGSFVSVLMAPTGEEVRVPEAGVVNFSEYASKFEAAVDRRDRAVERQSLTDFDGAAYHGIAAIEAYFNWHAIAWDHFHPQQPITRKKQMSLDDKIKVWLPVLATGSSLDYKAITWKNFFEVKKLRNRATHATAAASGATLEELACRLNLFVTAIAAPLMQLHQVFHERIPSAVIRATYSPEVYVAEE